MVIVRDGKNIELSDEEVRAAWSEYENKSHLETAKNHLQVAIEYLISDEMLPEGYEIDMSLLEELVHAYKDEIFGSEFCSGEDWDVVVNAYLKEEGVEL